MQVRRVESAWGLRGALFVIALAGCVVPGSRRTAWRDEWSAEVWYRWRRLEAWGRVTRAEQFGLIRTCMGAFFDAAAVRRDAVSAAAFGENARCVWNALTAGRAAVLVPLFSLGMGAAAASVALTVAASVFGLWSGAPSVVVVSNHVPGVHWEDSPLSVPEFRRVRAARSTIRDVEAGVFAAERAEFCDAGGASEASQIRIERVTAGYLGLFDVRCVLGCLASFGSDPTAVVLHERFWREQCGADPDLIGRSIRIGGVERRVVAVVSEGTRFVGRIDVWERLDERALIDDPERRFLYVVGRLAPSTTPEAAASALTDLVHGPSATGYDPSASELGWYVLVQPQEARFVESLRPHVPPLVALVVGLFLIGVASGAGFVSRRLAEQREPGISRPVAFGLCLALCAAAISAAAAGGALAYIPGVLPAEIRPAWAAVSPLTVSAVAAALALSTSLVFGVRLLWLRRAPRGGNFSAARWALGVQVLLAVVAGATGVVRAGAISLNQWRIDTAIGDCLIVRADPRATESATIEATLDRVAAIPGVECAGAVNVAPSAFARSYSSIEIDGPDAPTLPCSSEIRVATPGYFRAVGLAPVEGRLFDSSDSGASAPVAVVNAAFVHELLHDGATLDRKILVFSPGLAAWHTVVGVVEDQSLTTGAAAAPVLYLPAAQRPAQRLVIVARAEGGVEKTASTLRAVFAAERDCLPGVAIARLDRLVADETASERGFAFLTLSFAALALLLVGAELVSALVRRRRRAVRP